MRKAGFALAALTLLTGQADGQRADRDDPLLRPIAADYAARWLEPQAPVRLHGQSYYVGFKGLGVVLVRTSAGLILFDGGVPQSVRAIQANIRKLGFDPKQIKYILVTEPHWDHAGGVAALARDSGAMVIAGAAAVAELRRGNVGPDDPQAGIHAQMPGVTRVRGVRDGEQVRLGGVTVTAQATPGHTAGSTSWSWQSCEGKTCATLVFAASINPVSADEYRFTDHPERVALLRRGAAKLAALRCDIAIPSHPDTNDTLKHLAALERSRVRNPLLDKAACRSLAATYSERLDARLAKEKAERR
ncbi:subclass B3 metallo-beta-lactamase [Sphingomonas sp. BT-65]|uniref:subclass B3 metallo-beta-lactamase n=1 Tax=Sphingomonas sp. BT-65 TaxID=2989821 RepID=UPI0022366A70|nr:subclass B3 metallo-beta-lactamase [Sphingomonas sp. BT-65]MCW4461869.1 subclass B3 metallo-beta-lactamase [Sphingomonas sp. BT-65]